MSFGDAMAAGGYGDDDGEELGGYSGGGIPYDDEEDEDGGWSINGRNY